MANADNKTIKIAEDVERNWMSARGKGELLSHLRGEAMSLKKAVMAKCYDCMGGYSDGKVDCEVDRCPLHPFMSYNENKKSARNLSEESRKAISERMKKMQAEKRGQDQP